MPRLRAMKPANGPKPKSLTAKIASIISGKVRDPAIIDRHVIYTQKGAKFLAAPSPIGIDRAIHATVEIIAIQMLSKIPSQTTPLLSAKFGGKKEAINR